ncbi:uncharacterized protein LOC117100370, partial [Anneissia japonica]|uniref:uncharacterized protein LOC117100370 n=1 Tax=Anneissia japonica TaxID=1529436 RepID=UPI0014254DBE
MAVRKVVTDYESPVWQAIRQILPGVTMTGCLFHYTQAVFRKVQEFGLQQAYRFDAATHMIIRQLMALPTVPVEHVAPVFQRLEDSSADVPALQQIMTYMRSFWLDGTVFTPRDWVVYRQTIRTNNDLEGWHHRLNRRGKRAKIPFYMLCTLLYEEALT